MSEHKEKENDILEERKQERENNNNDNVEDTNKNLEKDFNLVEEKSDKTKDDIKKEVEKKEENIKKVVVKEKFKDIDYDKLSSYIGEKIKDMMNNEKRTSEEEKRSKEISLEMELKNMNNKDLMEYLYSIILEIDNRDIYTEDYFEDEYILESLDYLIRDIVSYENNKLK